jgi:hypothetical protein
MKMSEDWQNILRKAWSVRFLVMAGLLTAAEAVLPFFMHELPNGVFAVLSGVAVAAAFVARLVAQKDMRS